MSHGEVFAARQPIFDRHNLVSGYEILFRSGPENRFIAADSDLAASQSLERTLMTFGLEHLTEGKDCFVNISRRVLVSELYTLLPVQRSVIELLETVAPDSEVIQACRRLKDSGYRLALDDFTYRPEFDPLLELADVVKIDFRQAESRARAAIEQSGRYGSNLLAEKVETQGERSEAEGLGFQLFQGYFFCRPEMITNRVPTPSRANYLRLLREVAQHDLEFERIEAIIRQEVAFSIRLLRYLNSAGFGWRHEVDTIGHALRLLGVRQVQKWISAVATVGLAEGKPPALVATALVRARLAELLAEPVGLTQADLQLFFGGLLSLMDAMMDQPLDQIVGSMGVSPELAAGLLRREPPFGPVLDLVVAQERGEWDRLESIAANLGTPIDQVQTAYRSASSWAASLINAA